MTSFSGRWSTTFGAMLIEQRGSKVTGTYGHGASAGRVEGGVRGAVLRFRYTEPGERGTGEFRLLRAGKFCGGYTAKGSRRSLPWDGHRGWDGIWETDFGRMRLMHEDTRVHGFYSGAGHSSLLGSASGAALAFNYKERNAAGEGRFTLAADAQSFTGGWRARGRRNWQPWSGRRAHPTPGVTWLVVLEAHWQGSLAEPEYSFGNMLREVFARLPQVRVRQRYFHDAGSLEHGCRELLYIAEPAILLIASHALAGGLSVRGELIDTARVLDSLRFAENLKLLHFSSCLVALAGRKAFGRRPWPVSGYATRVDWGASALIEFTYLDLVLNRGMAPAEAAATLPLLVPYAGNRAPRGSPYRAAGFRFFPAG